MPSITVNTKLFYAIYLGTSTLSINATTCPWIINVQKIIRPSTGTGVNTRQSYNGSFGGVTPGGAVTTLVPNTIYEFTCGITNGWVLPDFSFYPVAAVIQKLTTPTGVQAVGTSSSSISVTASSVAGATGYQLYTSAATTSVFTKLGGILPSPTYSHTGLAASQKQFYEWQALGNGTTSTDSDLSVVFSGVTLANGATPYTLTPTGADYSQNGNSVDEIQGSGRHRHLSFAQLDIDTTAPTVTVSQLTTGSSQTVTAYVNGQFLQSMRGNVSTTLNLFGSGTRRLTLVEGSGDRDSEQGDIVGTTITSLSFPANTSSSFVKPTFTESVYAIGDSISNGAVSESYVLDQSLTHVRERHGYLPLLRKPTRSVTVSGYGSHTGWVAIGTSEGRAKELRQLKAGYVNGINRLLLVYGTNDFYFSSATPTDLATATGAFIDAVHADNSSTVIYLMTPLIRTDYTSTNGSNFSLDDYRSALAGLASGRSWLVVVNGLTMLSTNNLYDDRLHPSYKGHAELAPNWELIFAGATAGTVDPATGLVPGSGKWQGIGPYAYVKGSDLYKIGGTFNWDGGDIWSQRVNAPAPGTANTVEIASMTLPYVGSDSQATYITVGLSTSSSLPASGDLRAAIIEGIYYDGTAFNSYPSAISLGAVRPVRLAVFSDRIEVRDSRNEAILHTTTNTAFPLYVHGSLATASSSAISLDGSRITIALTGATLGSIGSSATYAPATADYKNNAGIARQYSSGFTIRASGASFQYQVQAAAVDIAARTTKTDGNFTVLLDGVREGTHSFASGQYDGHIFRIALPDTNAHTMQVVLGDELRGNETGDVLGVEIQSITPAGGTGGILTPAKAARQVVVFGDSISNGYGADSPGVSDWFGQRRSASQDITLVGYGSAQAGTQLVLSYYNSFAKAVLTSAFANCNDQRIVIQVGTNDRLSAQQTRNLFLSFLQRVHTDFPLARIAILTCLPRADEAGAGTAITREGQRNAASDYGCYLYEGGSLYDPNTGNIDESGLRIHPSQATYNSLATVAQTIIDNMTVPTAQPVDTSGTFSYAAAAGNPASTGISQPSPGIFQQEVDDAGGFGTGTTTLRKGEQVADNNYVNSLEYTINKLNSRHVVGISDGTAIQAQLPLQFYPEPNGRVRIFMYENGAQTTVADYTGGIQGDVYVFDINKDIINCVHNGATKYSYTRPSGDTRTFFGIVLFGSVVGSPPDSIQVRERGVNLKTF